MLEKLIDNLYCDPPTVDGNKLMEEDVDEEYREFESNIKLTDGVKNMLNTRLQATTVTPIPDSTDAYQVEQVWNLLRGYNCTGSEYLDLAPESDVFDNSITQKTYSYLSQLKEVYLQTKLIDVLEERKTKRLAATRVRETDAKTFNS
jgi:uncharacterized membrane protein YheB (UPF0754 family)